MSAILSSPDDCPHVQRVLHPKDSIRDAWLKPEVAITAMAHDSLMLPLMLMAHVKPEFIEKQPTLLSQVFARLEDDEPKPVKKSKSKSKSAAEIRAAVNKAFA